MNAFSVSIIIEYLVKMVEMLCFQSDKIYWQDESAIKSSIF